VRPPPVGFSLNLIFFPWKRYDFKEKWPSGPKQENGIPCAIFGGNPQDLAPSRPCPGTQKRSFSPKGLFFGLPGRETGEKVALTN